MAYDNNNKGTAWPNASENIKAPQWTGVAEVDGKPKRISVWMRTTKKGQRSALRSRSRAKVEASSAKSQHATTLTKILIQRFHFRRALCLQERFGELCRH